MTARKKEAGFQAPVSGGYSAVGPVPDAPTPPKTPTALKPAKRKPPRDPVTKRFVSASTLAARQDEAPEVEPATYTPAHLDAPAPAVPDAATVTVTADPTGTLITVEDRAALLQRIPAWVRGVLYVLVAVGSVLVAYAVSKRVIGADEVVLWLGITSALGIVAAGNLKV